MARWLSRADRTRVQAAAVSCSMDRASPIQSSALSVSQSCANWSAMSTRTPPMRRLTESTWRAACWSRRGGMMSRLTAMPTATPTPTSIMRSTNRGS
ncbi:hypothetical protein ACFFX0_09655 [Citricoccus parietis]|uniref:Uncharacterized protein n=1 Tax=Citricoccus parietis TaxID=592307 RepID=A0ABV5FYG2_9MICC